MDDLLQFFCGRNTSQDLQRRDGVHAFLHFVLLVVDRDGHLVMVVLAFDEPLFLAFQLVDLVLFAPDLFLYFPDFFLNLLFRHLVFFLP